MIISKRFSYFFSFVITIFLLANSMSYAEGGPGGGPQPPCGPPNKVCLVSAFETSGNETIAVCAGTSQSLNASKFNIWYNNSGPLNVTNGGIVSAEFYNGTSYDLAEGRP